MEDEIWKDVEGFEGYYQVSNKSRVKSIPRWKRKKEWILKPYTNGTGYLQVGLRRDGKVKMFLVHRLVMLHFNPIENSEDYDVNHKDFDTYNNLLENLEWCSRQENHDHYWGAVKNGKERSDGCKGTKHHLSVLNEDKVREIRRLWGSGEITNKRLLGRMFDANESTIRLVINYETWKDVV